MDYVFYPGCLSSTEQYAYEVSARRVCDALGISLIYPKDISCCGFPLRSVNSYGWLYLAARMMAILESYNKPAMLLCNWCHLSFTYAKRLLENNELLSWGDLCNSGIKSDPAI